MIKKYITTTEAAEILGVSTESVRRYAKKGLIPCVKIGLPGKHQRIRFIKKEIQNVDTASHIDPKSLNAGGKNLTI